jgi:hypothetical protein
VFSRRQHDSGLSYLQPETSAGMFKCIKLCRLSKVIKHVVQEIKKMEYNFYLNETG